MAKLIIGVLLLFFLILVILFFLIVIFIAALWMFSKKGKKGEVLKAEAGGT